MSERNNARRIWASTPQNCATTNGFFLNERRLFRNGIRKSLLIRLIQRKEFDIISKYAKLYTKETHHE